MNNIIIFLGLVVLILWIILTKYNRPLLPVGGVWYDQCQKYWTTMGPSLKTIPIHILKEKLIDYFDHTDPCKISDKVLKDILMEKYTGDILQDIELTKELIRKFPHPVKPVKPESYSDLRKRQYDMLAKDIEILNALLHNLCADAYDEDGSYVEKYINDYFDHRSSKGVRVAGGGNPFPNFDQALNDTITWSEVRNWRGKQIFYANQFSPMIKVGHRVYPCKQAIIYKQERLAREWGQPFNKITQYQLNNELDIQAMTQHNVPFYNGNCVSLCQNSEQNRKKDNWAQISEYTTAWESRASQNQKPYKDGSKDLYLLIVPRVHICTTLDNDPLRFIRQCTYDKTIQTHPDKPFTEAFMFLLQDMVLNGLRYAKHLLGRRNSTNPIRYVYPQIGGGYIIQPANSGFTNIYCTFHHKGQSKNHLHMHMWCNGEDDGFQSTIDYQKNLQGQFAQTKTTYDVTEAMPLEVLFKLCGGANPTDNYHVDFGFRGL